MATWHIKSTSTQRTRERWLYRSQIYMHHVLVPLRFFSSPYCNHTSHGIVIRALNYIVKRMSCPLQSYSGVVHPIPFWTSKMPARIWLVWSAPWCKLPLYSEMGSWWNLRVFTPGSYGLQLTRVHVFTVFVHDVSCILVGLRPSRDSA